MVVNEESLLSKDGGLAGWRRHWAEQEHRYEIFPCLSV